MNRSKTKFVMNIIRKRNRKSASRLGASVIEFALIAPLMITFTFGLVELGRMMLVKQTATHATREGARLAVRPLANSERCDRARQRRTRIVGDRERDH